MQNRTWGPRRPPGLRPAGQRLPAPASPQPRLPRGRTPAPGPRAPHPPRPRSCHLGAHPPPPSSPAARGVGGGAGGTALRAPRGRGPRPVPHPHPVARRRGPRLGVRRDSRPPGEPPAWPAPAGRSSSSGAAAAAAGPILAGPAWKASAWASLPPSRHWAPLALRRCLLPGLSFPTLLTEARSDVGDLSHVVARGSCYKCFLRGRASPGAPGQHRGRRCRALAQGRGKESGGRLLRRSGPRLPAAAASSDAPGML